MSRRRCDPWLLTAVFALAAMVRAIPWRMVFAPDAVVFRDGDAYSHMWRIWNAAANSVPLSARDPFVNFPHGGEVLWSPAFDWVLAGVVRGLGLDLRAAEVLAAWVPLLLGSVSVALAAHVAWRSFAPAAGWVTGLLLAVLPGSFAYTQLGYLDHHAAISLVGTLLLAGAMKVVSAPERAPAVWPWLGGALCALALLVWAGSLLHVVVLQVALLAWALGAERPERARRRTLELAGAHAVAALVLLPFSLRTWELFGSLSPLVLTRFQPLWFGAGALTLAASSALWRVPHLGEGAIRRLASSAVLAGAGLLVAFVTLPGLDGALARSAAWFTGDVAQLPAIGELGPLFGMLGPPAWKGPVVNLSPLFFALPLPMLVVLRTGRAEHALLFLWCAVFAVLTIHQYRFINTFSIAYGIVWGGGVARAIDWSRSRLPDPFLRRAAWGLAAAATAVLVLVPAVRYYRLFFVDAPSQLADLREARTELARAAARWLAASNPVPVDASGTPLAGVLCEWEQGHEVRYRSGWPVHQDGFGPYSAPRNMERAQSYFAAWSEDRALESLAEMGTRYVFAERWAQQREPSPRSLRARLLRLHGSAGSLPDASGRRVWVPALTRHRLVFQARNHLAEILVYEVVAGAWVEGRAAPASQVQAELVLRSGAGRHFTWTSVQAADESGRFRLRLPHATDPTAGSDLSAIGPYTLNTSDRSVELQVPLEAVRSGATISLPSEAGGPSDRGRG